MDARELANELAQLDDQVKLLVKTERRLLGAQRVIEDQLGQFQALNELALRISRATDPETILDSALATLLEVLKVDQALAFLTAERGGLFVAALKTQRGLAPQPAIVWDENTPPPQLPRLVFRSDRAGPTVDDDIRLFLDLVSRYLSPGGGNAAHAAIDIVLTLRRKGKDLLGIVVLRKIGEAPSFHEHIVCEDDLPFLDLVGSHAEAALENVLLYRQLSQAAQQLERKVAERTTDLARSQDELARALTFREQVMGILGHDLRNPLSVVRMSAGLVLRREGLGDDVRRQLLRIDSAANRMIEMIGTLLDFTQSRFRANLPVSPEDMDLHEVCRGVIDELVATNPGRTIQILADGDARGRWDPARMAQLVSNLVGNALAHGSKSEPVQVSLAADDGAVVLEVRNRGPVIAPELVPVLFEPFRRGPGAERTSRTGGLGLGLYIVHHIVRAHDGKITLESTEEQGTVFRVRLPRAGAGAPASQRPQNVPVSPTPPGATASETEKKSF